ncbi:MAG: anthranilate synthase component I family protein [Chitinophagaceae bacterium]
MQWSDRFSVSCFLDNNQYSFNYHSIECMLAVGVKRAVKAAAGNAFTQCREFCSGETGWIFGHLGYDLKNELEQLQSTHEDHVGFADLFFFVPQIVVLLGEKEMFIKCDSASGGQAVHRQISETPVVTPSKPLPVALKNRFAKQEYIETIRQLKQFILHGDCYEINFCQEFYSENVTINPLDVYGLLTSLSPNPFATYYRVEENHLLCASPERYIKKQGNDVIAQPIKGTWPRDLENEQEDLINKNKLLNNNKERAENVMIVDLVRNDLSKVCEEGTVKVTELFGIYSFPQVHQMISTISGTIQKDLDWIDIIKATFPMGSMTGAPKKRVMELIEQYEKTKRGLFSGAVGYITPQGDFDFNVVIRSILYNSRQKYLSCQVGSGITFHSDPEMEYEECLLKAGAIKKVLE